MRRPMPSPSAPADPSQPSFGVLLLPLACFTVLAWASQLRHLDIGDAQLYQVVARHLAQDHAWISLRSAGAPFTEHLPFGFWPMAVVIRLFSEAALPWWQLAVSLATVVWTGALSRALAGRWADLAATTVLGLTQNFFFQATLTLLDPLLILLATGAAAVWLAGRRTPSTWALALLLCAGGIAVKGPFGALPFCCAVVARALVDRSWKDLFLGAAIAVLAALPVAFFLLTQPAWREGYLLHQLVASATGARADGELGTFAALRTLAGRFWPGLPLLVPAACAALGWPRGAVAWLGLDANATRASRLLGVTCLLMAVGLSLPARKVANHVFVAFPLLSAWCAVPWAPRLRRLTASASGRRAVALTGVALLAASVAVVAAGLADWESGPPCVGSREFSGELSKLAPGESIWVVSSNPNWGMIESLQAERRLTPWYTAQLDQPTTGGPDVAVVEQAVWEAHAGGWVEVLRARGWVLARRP